MLEEEKVVGLTQLAILSTHCDMFWIIERMDLIELFAIFERLDELAVESGVDTPYWSLPSEVREEFVSTLTRVLARAVNNSLIRSLIRLLGTRGERFLAGTIFPVEK